MVGRRRARTVVVERLDAGDLGLNASTVGLAASPTKVAHMEPVPLPDRSCLFVGSDGLTYDGLVRALADVGALAAPADRPVASEVSAGTGDASPRGPASRRPERVGRAVDRRQARTGVLELLSKATELAPALGGGVAAVVAGDHLSSAVDELARHGVDVVFVAEDEALDRYRASRTPRSSPDSWPTVARPPCCSGQPPRGDLARGVAMLDTGLAADCTDLTVAPWERRGARFDALLHQIRPAMAGGVLATCVCPKPARRWRPYARCVRTTSRAAAGSHRSGVGGVGAHRPSGGSHRPGDQHHRHRSRGSRRDHRRRRRMRRVELAPRRGARRHSGRSRRRARAARRGRSRAPRPAGRPDRHDGTPPRLHRLRHLGCTPARRGHAHRPNCPGHQPGP